MTRSQEKLASAGGCIYGGRTCANFPNCVCKVLFIPKWADGPNVDRRPDPRSERQGEIISMYRAEI